MFTNIVVATDGSKHATKALNVAIDLAKKYDATLTLVHILTHDHPAEEMERMIEIEHLDGSPLPKDLDPEMNRISSTLSKKGMLRSGDKESRIIVVIGEQILKAAKRLANESGVKKVKMKIRNGDYANGILEVANGKGADIIIMGRRGLSPLKGFITGSVSHKVTQRADCSVLTVK